MFLLWQPRGYSQFFDVEFRHRKSIEKQYFNVRQKIVEILTSKKHQLKFWRLFIVGRHWKCWKLIHISTSVRWYVLRKHRKINIDKQTLKFQHRFDVKISTLFQQASKYSYVFQLFFGRRNCPLGIVSLACPVQWQIHEADDKVQI